MSAIEDSVRRKVDISARAREDAQNGAPARSAVKMTATENELVEEIRRKILERVSAFDDQERQVVDKCEKFPKLFDEADKTIAEVEQAQKPDDALLNAARAKMERTADHYQMFKTDHNLAREAEESNRMSCIAWAVTVTVIEGVLNCFFFAEASDLGLLGGFFQAFIFSIINVTFAFMAGTLCFPYKNHINPAKLLGGIVGFSLFFAVCIVIVVFSALYRGALDALKDTVEVANLQDKSWSLAVENFLNIKMSAVFASLNSFLLVFIGAICAILGVWKGYSANDPYPGFGKMGEQKRDAEEDFNEEQEKYNALVSQFRRRHSERLADALRNAQNEFHQLNSEARGYIDAVNQDENPLQHALDLSRRLLSEYRDKNWRLREGARPAYFESYPVESDFPLISQKAREWDARFQRIRAMEETIQRLGRDMHERGAKIQQIKAQLAL